MTTLTFPQNKVILFAQIDQRRAEKKGKEPDPAIRRVRNVVNGSDYLVSLQVAAPYGGSYQMEVEVGNVEGSDLFRQATAGQLVVLEGHLTRTRDEDVRFRDYEADQLTGILYQEVQFQVERVRPAAEGEARGTGSNVFIEGTVVEPPVFMRHPDYPEIELARLTVRARTKPALSEEGPVRAGRPCDVTIVIPTEDEGAAFLYRRGNRVRLRGVIDRLAVRQNRTQVTERLRALDKGWRATREGLRARSAEDPNAADRELRYEGSRYVRERERLQRGARTMVLAVEVTPMPGATPATREEAVADREAFNLEYEASREARRQERKERRRGNQERERAARAAEAAEAAEAAAPAKPRRKAAGALAEPTLAEQAQEPVMATGEAHAGGVSA